MDQMLIDELGVAWQRGWQPRDLLWVAGHDLGSAEATSLARAILAEADGHRARFDPRWQSQLDHIGREHPRTQPPGDHAQLLCAYVSALPALPRLVPPPGDTSRAALSPSPPGQALDQRILVRVRALLAKAESTTFPDEAEALSGKAHELMARYAIDQVLLSAGSQEGHPEAERIHIENPYLNPKVTLLTEVATANRCRVVWNKGLRMATVFGFRADLEITELLFTSLLVQATTAMLAEQPPFAWEIKSFRSSFLISYGQRIGERLAAISDEAQAEVADGSLLPVLASRREAVDTARDEAFPDLRALTVSLSNADGLLAGQAAADRADLHRGRVRGATGLLDRT